MNIFKICLKIYCDNFLNTEIIIVKQFIALCHIRKGPGYFQGTTLS